MNSLNRFFILLISVLVLCFVLRELVFKQVVSYKTIGFRSGFVVNDVKFRSYIDSFCASTEIETIADVVDLSLGITSDRLYFTADKNAKNPNILFKTQSAHCVGYAQFFASVCNYVLSNHRLQQRWIAKPQIGQVYVMGVNVHQFFMSPFLKDHDFVIIENIKTKQQIAVDPTVYDYFLIDYVRIK